MISARLSIRGTFGEPFELEEFPYDVQDMKIILASTANAHTQILVPHFRRNEFVKIQMQVSSLPEWRFDRCLVEFILSKAEKSSRGHQYSTVTLNCKLVRKWKSYIKRVNLMMAVISCTQFTVFSLDAVDDQADRLSNSFALVLTALIFIFVAANSLPNVPYLTQLDEYIYAIFFLMLMMSVECAVVPHTKYPQDYETACVYGFALAWVLIHLIMAYRGYRCVQLGKEKLNWTSRDYMLKGFKEVPAIGVKSNKNRQPNHDYWSTRSTDGDGMETASLYSETM